MASGRVPNTSITVFIFVLLSFILCSFGLRPRCGWRRYRLLAYRDRLSGLYCYQVLPTRHPSHRTLLLFTEVLTHIIRQLPRYSLIRHNAVNLNQRTHPYISLQERQQRIRPVKLSVMVNQCKHRIVYNHLFFLCGLTGGAATVRKIAVTRCHPRTPGCA